MPDDDGVEVRNLKEITVEATASSPAATSTADKDKILSDVSFETAGGSHPHKTATEGRRAEEIPHAERQKALATRASEVVKRGELPYLPGYVRDMARGSLRINAWAEFTPEEMALLELTMSAHRIGTGHDEDQERIWKAGFYTLRNCLAQYSGGRLDPDTSRWRTQGLDSKPIDTPNTKAIIKDLNNILNGASPNDRQSVFDTAVLAALSTGNAQEAVGIMLDADSLKPSASSDIDQTEAALNRIMDPNVSGSAFAVAYEAYPQAAKDRIDGVLVKMLEGRVGEASAKIRAKALERLENRAGDRLDAWYSAQKVVDTEQRIADINDKAITRDVEDAIDRGKTYDEIRIVLTEKAGRVADGEAANIIAAELSYRLRPELRRDRVIDSMVDSAMDSNRTALYINPYNDPALRDLMIGDADRRRVVREGPPPSQFVLRDQIFDGSGKIGLNELASLISDPKIFRGVLDSAHTSYRNESRLRADEPDRPVWIIGYKAMGEKMAGGLAYLQTIAANSEGRRLLITEFGFSEKMLDTSRIAEADNMARELFPDAYAGISEETAHEQKRLDEKTAVDLAEARKFEAERLADETLGKIPGILDGMESAIHVETQAAALAAETSRNDTRSQIADAERNVGNAEQKLRIAESMQVAGRLFNRDAPTQEQKDSAIKEANNALEEARQALKDLQGQLEGIGVFGDRDGDTERKLDSIRRLQSELRSS